MGISRWCIGLPEHVGPGDGVVAFTEAEFQAAAASAAKTMRFDEAMEAQAAPAQNVAIFFPAYRPRSLIPVLAWLAVQLSSDDAEISWHLDKRQGPDSVRRLLEGLGWVLGKERDSRRVRLHGQAPGSADRPEPDGFTACLGSHEVRLAADYGIFSPGHLDVGTAELLDVALRHEPVNLVADIGIGYGPLAIGLVVNSVAQAAVGSDVDCVALWLARHNARSVGVPVEVRMAADPGSLPRTALTVCNIPTHINAQQTAQLMAALARRAEIGTLLAVVHASLGDRYARYLADGRLRVSRHDGQAHVVLEATRRGG